jgi:hypothetical protein
MTGGFSSQIVDVTPSMARDLLAGNTENRSLRPDYVRQLAGAMKRGEWILNGEAIQVSDDGLLLNGQHRLSAVVESGVTVKMLIVRGLTVTARRTVDTGTRRNLSDVLALHGKSDTNLLASVLGLLHRYRNEDSLHSSVRTAPTVAQALQLLEREPGVEDSIPEARRFHRECGLRMTVGAFLLYLFEETDQGAGVRFFEAVCHPESESEGSAAIVLRAHLDRVRAETNYQFTTVVLLAMTIKAFNAWREGRPVEVLSYRPGAVPPEEFPKIAPPAVASVQAADAT